MDENLKEFENFCLNTQQPRREGLHVLTWLAWWCWRCDGVGMLIGLWDSGLTDNYADYDLNPLVPACRCDHCGLIEPLEQI